jgi:hypothetical protein
MAKSAKPATGHWILHRLARIHDRYFCVSGNPSEQLWKCNRLLAGRSTMLDQRIRRTALPSLGR